MKKNYRRVVLILIGIIVAIASLNGCGNTSNTAQDEPDSLAYTVETLYEGFQNPWGMVWLPDGRQLITERAGEILVFRNDKFTGEKITGLPQVLSKSQGGLLDIKLHPDYESNKWIYISYSKPVEDSLVTTAVARFRLDGNTAVDVTDVFLAKPFLKTTYHFGSRIAFDKDNYMYVSVGERGQKEMAQSTDNDMGKVHRLFDDGRIPDDNPFAGEAGASASIWSYGHRNPQGLVYDEVTNRIWETEHGPRGGDELNLIEKGKNYGWPRASYGINYDSTVLTEFKEIEGMQGPVTYWVPSPGVCGVTVVTSDRYKPWKGNLLVSSMALRHIARVKVDGTSFVKQEKLLTDVARVRCIVESPDGFIYAITEGPGLLVKLVPGVVE